MCKKYEGYENYETWAVSLWLNNDEGTYTYWRERAKELQNKYRLADEIKELINETNPHTEPSSLFVDLLQAAIDSANYDEVAESFMDNISEKGEDEDGDKDD